MEPESTLIVRVNSVTAVELALRKNTIAVIESENGKTVVALMMIREIEKCLKDKTEGKKKIAFLAPTVHLVQKQLKEVKLYTDLDVEGYYGAKGVDEWNALTWENEINEHYVFIMTPQVMLDALRKTYIRLDLFCFIIIDECHEAVGNHPLAKILKEFYVKISERPKIFGMTSSLTIGRGFSSNNGKKERLNELESLLDSQVHIVEDSFELEEHFSTPKSTCRFYNPTKPLNMELIKKLEITWSQFEASLAMKLMDYQHKSLENSFKPLLNRFSSDNSEILFCLTKFGPVCALEAVKFCIENAIKIQEEFIPIKESVLQYENFLHGTLAIIEEHVKLLDCEGGGKDALSGGGVSSKLHTLFEIFRSFRDEKEFFCIIFVKRIFAAKMIEKLMKQMTDLCHLTVSYSPKPDLVGNMRQLAETSESFHSGKVNLLFSADVPEEGIPVVKCSCVIAFDLPESIHNFVRSWKLALRIDPLYVIMLERGNTQQIDQIWSIITSENSITTFEPLVGRELSRCRENIQLDAALETMDGHEINEVKVEKEFMDLNVCEKVQEIGTLNQHVLPSIEECSENCSISTEQDLASGEGTTKRKELHGSINVSTLYGTWGHGDSFLYAYKMHFACSIPEQKFSSFVLLLEKKLEDDVGNFELELFLVSKFIKCSVSFSGGIYLDSKKVDQAKCFQELIFNGLFGKLFVKASGARIFLLEAEDSLCVPSNMYLLLPLESEKTSIVSDTMAINWEGVESCVSAVEFLKSNALLNFSRPDVTSERSCTPVTDRVSVKYEGNVIRLANKSASPNSLKQMVVVAIHTGRIYSVLDIIPNSSSASPFEGGVSAEYSSYADYYYKKYGIVLKHPEQPLLLLKQSHNAHNLLVHFRTADGKNNMVKKPQQHACLSPELLVLTNISTYVLKPFYLLPSVMHRLESLMLANQLRDEIFNDIGKFDISSSLILQALTTLRCCEMFSMERLELLGDSVLKYVVSCHLFLKYPKKHEGKLSSRRSEIICNMNLHKLGVNRKIQRYIRDCAFDPRRWTAPGQKSIWPSPCTHGVDTTEVPYESKFFSEDTQLFLGKICDKGHRWMGSKTISDCVEALIGAFYVGGGLTAAISLMKWLGIESEFDHSLTDDVIKSASLHSFSHKIEEDINILESKIGYKFSYKGLLLEAITHDTAPQQGVSFCYERLEFLGDAVLGLLITQYLYENHNTVDPGELTDLRSVSVSNDNFAMAAVKWRLYPHLQHGSITLEKQISDFIKYVSDMSTSVLNPDAKTPKALGDLVESIAGAVLIDSKLNVGEVWRAFEPLLSPIVTPDKLELAPSRALIELCDNLGYFIKEDFVINGGVNHAELKLQLENELLTSKGLGSTKKAAKGMAALQMLKKLESKGISGKNRADNFAAAANDNDLHNDVQPKKRKLIIDTPDFCSSS